MRVAAIDLGTNATRLLVADVEDGRVSEVHRRTTITRSAKESMRAAASSPFRSRVCATP